MTITEFLTARLDEDEAVAMGASSHPDPAAYARDNYGHLWIEPSRLLAEVEAKRRVLHRFGFYVERLLALPYADHPDFQKEWGA